MQQRKVDYIIVGQGIAGTWLSNEFLQRGKKIIVINHENENSASLKAAGLYNPITGRKMIKTWMADDLFSRLEQEYKLLEKKLKTNFLHSIPIYRSFQNAESKNDWDGKQNDENTSRYIKEYKEKGLEINQLNDSLGGIVLNNSGYVDLPKLIYTYRKSLIDKKIYINEKFEYPLIEFNNNSVTYKNWEASKIIFCEGANKENPYWKDLPFRLVRGELMDISCDLQLPFIFNQGMFIIPKENLFTVGSTYDHKLLSYEPQKSGIDNLKNRLEKILTRSYDIINKRAGIRPATYDRKPFIGVHHEIKTLAIFNGFGTKGVSLTPYFAKHFADVLDNKCQIDKEVNVQRVL